MLAYVRIGPEKKVDNVYDVTGFTNDGQEYQYDNLSIPFHSGVEIKITGSAIPRYNVPEEEGSIFLDFDAAADLFLQAVENKGVADDLLERARELVQQLKGH